MFSLAYKKESLIIIWDCCHMTERTIPSSCLLALVTKWLTSGKMLTEVVGGTLSRLFCMLFYLVTKILAHLFFVFHFIFENTIHVYKNYDNNMHPQSPQIPFISSQNASSKLFLKCNSS